ncbi:MAG: pyruvate, phosphate dikinase [Spirochaetes bacterium]|nr:pyruvate, phosphate dikinase [Spirochaetota bacterium]
MSKKFVYFFGSGKADGKAAMKQLLGGKGANLAEMTNLKLPVPPGFTITTEVCDLYYKNKKKYPTGLDEQINSNLVKLEKAMGKKLGDNKNPLLVSVRSGAAVSMPGMMDTVLNLGLNDLSLQGLVAQTGNERFGWDAYRRFINMFGDVVMNVPHEEFEHALQTIKTKYRAKNDTDLNAAQLKEVVSEYKKIYKKFTKEDFPSNPKLQLKKSIEAVFSSWNNPRANKYREINDIKGLLGTAVNVQAMVFGNMGNDCGTGVCFTRNPSTGENKFYGEYLMNAQGEDVVAGIRTPEPISHLQKTDKKAYDRLISIRHKLEKHYKDMQDIEFTIENEKLYMLQTRTGKRTAAAAVQIAVDMMKEKLIDQDTAIMRIEPQMLDQLLHPTFETKALAKSKPIASGLPASPGAAVGQVVFSADEAEKFYESNQYKNIILVRIETSPEDIGGMNVSKGILTARGGMTSHAAVVARGMGKCCVAGSSSLKIDYKTKSMNVKGKTIKQGDWISLDGSAGNIYSGKLPTMEAKLTGPFGQIMKMADSVRKLGVRTNADTPADTKVAVEYGAEGIGLCRTEHMFFDHPGEKPGTRIKPFRQLIMVAEKVKLLRESLESAKIAEEKTEIAQIEKELAKPLKQYKEALAALLPLQRKDFEGIFKALQSRPCTVRLLDPPLHEFLPHDEKGQAEMATLMNLKVSDIKRTVESLHEFNPMLGHRGCRLGLTYPEITQMQVQAIIEAAINVKRNFKIKVHPEIMVPLIGTVKELSIVKEQIQDAIAEVFKAKKSSKQEIPYLIGTMIEIPRAAITSDEVAKVAEFFSFGTNDLTQMGCGFSRDDAGKFLVDYVKMGIYEYDPFQVLDQAGIGKLVEMSVKLGKSTNPNLKVGICGEHGGEPMSVKFCHRTGLNYVSCSPYRLPIARLSAAQAVIEEKRAKKKK